MLRASTSASNSGVDFLLAPYRVLDLTDERGLLAGKILADLAVNDLEAFKVLSDKAKAALEKS